MSAPISTAALILAAGSSSRMEAGRHKLLLPLGDRPVLAHVLTAVLASQARPIVVVLGHHANQVRAAIASYTNRQALVIIENPAYQQGMSSSLRAGLQALLQQHEKLDSAIILLGDQPLVTPSVINGLIGRRQESQKRIVAPLYNGKRGNPILFEASLFPELMEVRGDEGGRSVIARHRDEIASLKLEDTLADYDVDTWEAYQNVVAAWQGQHDS
ncbi:nucleotidyltransferase family protein [Ktedonosporobacter rubrisoli]|uniref:Nucleotidyltransferase family protein n=1 Tax=Ktedonosporobacter rubrisoli TaxID=2509675 RepID=A0A4P6K2V0_KTERU|nr:nucleotidyltransferase family protein [Ktedonosporobacter rubrisoli]QBD82479.1 nucleotidyltransferase family protein [Ktedonosporobacter rubrisoli]